MSKRITGEITIAANGKTYRLKFGTYALMELESELGRPFVAIVEELNDPARFSIKTAITMIWAALQDHHEGVSMKEAAAIIDDLGIQAAADKIGEALVAAFPELEKGAAGDGTENPKASRRQRRAAAAKKKTRSTGKGS